MRLLAELGRNQQFEYSYHNRQQPSLYPDHGYVTFCQPYRANLNSVSQNESNYVGGRYTGPITASSRLGRQGVAADVDGDGDATGGTARSHLPHHPVASETSSNPRRDEDERHEDPRLERARAYPEETRRVSRGDRIYHVDKQGRPPGQERSRRESEPPEIVADEMAQLEIGTSRQRLRQPAERHTFPTGGTYHLPASGKPQGSQHSPTNKPKLATGDGRNNPRPNIIRASSKIKDEDLDKR